MTSFDERGRGFESAFVHGQDLAFRARARRDRALGLWAAERLGHAGEAAERYAADLLAAAMAGGDAAVAAKLSEDLNRRGPAFTEAEIRARLDEGLAPAPVPPR